MHKRSRSHELLEFEIAFYERLVEEHPNFVDALVALGDAYTRYGRHEEGLRVDLKLAELKHNDPAVWYNLACSYALLKRSDESFEALRQAVALGYDDFEYLMKDPDLATLRSSPQLRQLLEQHLASKSRERRPVGP